MLSGCITTKMGYVWVYGCGIGMHQDTDTRMYPMYIYIYTYIYIYICYYYIIYIYITHTHTPHTHTNTPTHNGSESKPVPTASDFPDEMPGPRDLAPPSDRSWPPGLADAGHGRLGRPPWLGNKKDLGKSWENVGKMGRWIWLMWDFMGFQCFEEKSMVQWKLFEDLLDLNGPYKWACTTGQRWEKHFNCMGNSIASISKPCLIAGGSTSIVIMKGQWW